jgi:hypothetical protein
MSLLVSYLQSTGINLTVNAGAVAAMGSADLRIDRVLPVSFGAVAAAVNPIDMPRNVVLWAETGALAVASDGAYLKAGRLDIEPGALSVAASVDALIDRALHVEAGRVAASSYNVHLRKGYSAFADITLPARKRFVVE